MLVAEAGSETESLGTVGDDEEDGVLGKRSSKVLSGGARILRRPNASLR